MSDADRADLRNQEILGITKEVALEEFRQGKHTSAYVSQGFNSPSRERIEHELDEVLEPKKYKWLKFKQKLHRWFPFLCCPKYHHRSGANVYSECPICLRRHVRVSLFGYSPVDTEWLRATGNCSLLDLLDEY